MKRLTALFLSVLLMCVYAWLPVSAEEDPNEGTTEEPAEYEAMPGEERTEETEEQELLPESEADQYEGKTYQIPLFTEPHMLSLPHNNTSFWYMIPSDTELSYAELHLVLDSTDTLLSDYSTVTIEVNNVMIASVNLIKLKQEHDNVLTVAIPLERLKTDGTLNQLSIITAQRSILGDCADIDNPSNWITIKENSCLNLVVAKQGTCSISTVFPFYFNRIDALDAIASEIVVPSTNFLPELSAAASIASAAGYRYPYKSEVYFPVSFGNPKGLLYNQMSFGKDPALKEDSAKLSLEQNEYHTTLNVTASTPKGLEKAVTLLSRDEYLKQFKGTEYTVESEISAGGSEFEAHANGIYTLEDFGYSDVNLAGAFHQQTYYSIKQPDAIAGAVGSYIEIHFRHSDALIGDTSLLTVYLDNVAASSIQLSPSNADDGSLRVMIPADVLKKDMIDVRIDVYNYLGKIDCSKDWFDVAWTVIDSDSIVYFEPSDYSTMTTLERFPSFHASTSSDPHIIEVVAGALSETTAEIITTFAARASQNSMLPFRYNVVKEASTEKNQDQVFIGTVLDVQIPEAIKSELYLKPSGSSYEIKEGVNTVPEVLRDQVVIQAVRSPYDNSRKVYVITYPDTSYAPVVLNLLQDKKLLNEVGGVVTLVSKNNDVTVIETAETIEQSIKVPYEQMPMYYLNKLSRKTGISRNGLIIIAVCILVILFLLIRAARKKDQFKTARKKMEGKNKKKSEFTDEEDEDFEKDDR